MNVKHIHSLPIASPPDSALKGGEIERENKQAFLTMPPSTEKRFEQACLATKKSHGPRSQVLFDMCYQVLHQNLPRSANAPPLS